MGEKLMFCISDAFIDGDRIRGSIHNVVDKAFESGLKMSSCRYKDYSITLDVSFGRKVVLTRCCSKSSTATESGKPLNALIMNG